MTMEAHQQQRILLSEKSTLDEKFSNEEYIYCREPDEPSEDLISLQHASLMKVVLANCRIGMDLTSVACPTFILKPKSFLEISADCLVPTDDLLYVQELSCPVQRILSLARWMIPSLTVCPSKTIFRTKPYNPILGEQFICSWNHDNSVTRYFAEQTSHHPPVSTCYMENEKQQIRCTLNYQPKATFQGNAVVNYHHGKFILYLDKIGEEYELEMPPVAVKGILWGVGHVCHSRSLLITNRSSQLVLKLDVTSPTEVDGTLCREEVSQGYFYNSTKLSKICRIWGNFYDKIYIQEDESMEKKLFLDVSQLKKPQTLVKPLAKQSPVESRRVWHEVSYPLFYYDFESAAKNKHELEESERQKRREREVSGEQYLPKLFMIHETTPHLFQLNRDEAEKHYSPL